jgi:hypothetical protein
MLTKNEDLKYQLETLESYEPKDIDSPEFDVAYEGECGEEGFATICCVELAKRSLERIKELEGALKYYKYECSGYEPSVSVFQRMVDEAGI